MTTRTKEINTFADKMADGLKRSRIVRKWDRRIKRTGMSRAKFCEKHKLDQAQLCRYIAGTAGPEWESIHAVENALFKENV